MGSYSEEKGGYVTVYTGKGAPPPSPVGGVLLRGGRRGYDNVDDEDDDDDDENFLDDGEKDEGISIPAHPTAQVRGLSLLIAQPFFSRLSFKKMLTHILLHFFIF